MFGRKVIVKKSADSLILGEGKSDEMSELDFIIDDDD